ncbi:MAG: DUF1801 domain-containing protein [Polyangiaceae bacterium]|nr:DUF1801 domain-containing protein [Polyangiaceae bacterium]
MKAKPTPPQTIDEYIATFPPEVQAILQKVRSTIQKVAPDATETINYQIPTFVLNGNLVHFAGYKNHIGFYPGAAGIAQFQSEITEYKNAKGSVQFPLTDPIPYPLIERIVQFRVEQNRAKTKKTKKR